MDMQVTASNLLLVDMEGNVIMGNGHPEATAFWIHRCSKAPHALSPHSVTSLGRLRLKQSPACVHVPLLRA